MAQAVQGINSGIAEIADNARRVDESTQKVRSASEAFA